MFLTQELRPVLPSMPEPERQLLVCTTFHLPAWRWLSRQIRRELNGLFGFLSNVIDARHGGEADPAGGASISEASRRPRVASTAVIFGIC